MAIFASHEWLAGYGRGALRSSFELEGAQVEQLENQLRAKGGVAPKPGSGGAGPIGTLTGAGDEGAKHTGDGRAGAGKSAGNDMLNNALGGSMAGALALQAMKSGGGGLMGKMPGAKADANVENVVTSEETEKAEVAAQLTGEGEDVATVADTVQQEEVDEQEQQEGEGPPEGSIEEMMGKAPDLSVADLYKYYSNRLARRAREAAILADQAVQEAWKQQQLARYWSRQALEDEAATMRSLPPPKDPSERDAWQLKVPPGWELPPSPLISTKDPRRVAIYSGCVTEPVLTMSCLGCLGPPHSRRRREGASFLIDTQR